MVNVGIKSGTNLHGSAYAFGRCDAWAARNFFNPAPNDKLPTALKQFGGVAGGAIKKDKLFYFGGYEGLRSFVGNALASNVPALGSLGGDPANSMVDAIKALQAAGVTPNPISLKLMGCTTTGANCTCGLIQGASVTSTTYVSSFPNTNTNDNGIGKIDYNPGAKHRINGMLFYSNYLANGEDHGITASYWQNSNPLKAYTISGNWTYVATSRLVNEFRMNHVDFSLIPDDANLFANGKEYPLNTGITSTGGFPNLEITGFAGQVMGSWRGRPTQFITHFYNFQENLSYLTAVEGEAPLVNTTLASTSGLISETQLKDMPLNGRSFDQLLTLNPGTANSTSNTFTTIFLTTWRAAPTRIQRIRPASK